MGPDSSVVPSGRTRSGGHKLKHKFHMKKKVLGGRALGEAAQGGGGVSFSGDIPGRVPVSPALSDPALEERLDK